MANSPTSIPLKQLLREARDCQAALGEIADAYDNGGAVHAIATLRNDWLSILRFLLNCLARAAKESVQAAETGAGLLCTAVRIGEALLSKDERIQWYQDFLPSANQFVDTSLKGKLLGNLGNALADNGRLEEAAAVLRERLSEARSRSDSVGEALGNEHLGKVLLRRGRYEEADALLSSAYELAVSRRDRASVTRLLKDVADAALRRGDADLSIRCLKERLERCEADSDLLLLQSTCSVLAERLLVIGKLESAKGFANRAITLARSLRLPLRVAFARGTLGNIGLEEALLDEAEQNFRSARSTFRKFHRIVEEAKTATSLGQIAHKRGKLRQARRWFTSALEIDCATGRLNDVAIDLDNLGRVHIDAHELAEAITAFEQRAEVLDKIHEQLRAARTRHETALLYAELQQFDRAIAIGQRALDFFEIGDKEAASQLRTSISDWERLQNGNG